MSITRQALIRVGVASVLLAGIGEVRAQMGYTAASIEWLVADSDIVVRASVAGVDRTPVVQAEDGMYSVRGS